MTPDFFVDALQAECRDAAVQGCVEQLRAPSGRRPTSELVRMSNWFNALDEASQKFVIQAMDDAADATLFGVLCVLDGVRVIEPAGEKSEFRLTVSRAGVNSVLAPGESNLHDLLRASQQDS
ncbi:hypothetical protein ACWKW4_14505 [Hydrogenophaga borbori]